MFGTSAYYFHYKANYYEYKNYHYSYQDSLFYSADSVNLGEKNFIEKKVDSKPEVLDFRTENIGAINTDSSKLKNSKINLNSAGINELTKLPGIGKTTAERIVEYRKNKGRINSINELLNIKGIGKTKLNKIKKFIHVE